MTNIVAGFVTSHATALIEPGRWDDFRGRIRNMYRERYKDLPLEPAQVAGETLEDNLRRYEKIRSAHDFVTRRIRELKPDAVIVIGNDQNENFGAYGTPQFAIYTGDSAVVSDWIGGVEKPYPCAKGIATAILDGCVARGFDVVQASSFQDGKLKAHAHAQVFARFVPNADVPIIPVFVNAITPPLPSARRCFEFGRALRAAIETGAPGKRVVIGASGGLSHFNAGFPYEALKVKRTMGEICEDFDRKLLSWIERGEFENVVTLTDEEILNNGGVEFRQGIAFLGALAAGTKPDRLVYEPFYRGIMGFWAGYWDLA